MSQNFGAQLRKVLKHSNVCVSLPGAFNGLVGRLCAEYGFSGVYVSGAAVSAAQGLPDIGVATFESFCNVIRDVTTASNLPCIADADTGFGETEMIRRTVFEYYRSGAAGFHIEDQVFPKRCGHLDGKTLISVDDMCAKVSRAKSASEELTGGDFIVCARTDARGVEGMESAVKRATAYVNNGADMIFPEGLHSEEEFRTFALEMRKLSGESKHGGPLLLANMTEFGKTPLIPVETFTKLKYDCVIFPVSTLRVAMKPVQELLSHIKNNGSVEKMLPNMYSRQELYDSLKYTPGKEWSFPSNK